MPASTKKPINAAVNRLGRRGMRADGTTLRQARAPQVEAIDLHIGGRVRLARSQRAMTRAELASRLGVSLQTLERYELGEMRLMASRLHAIADELEVPFGWFVEGFKEGAPEASDEVFRSMTIGNMQIIKQLSDLTYEQRGTIQRMIDAFRGDNLHKLKEQQAANAAGAANGAD